MLEQNLDSEIETLNDLLHELVELRRAVATTLGREQYVYHVLDRAIESHFEPALRHALDEFHRQPIDVQRRVLYAV
ncbi:MAG: hypothetical protein KF708_05985 [Pirellulales bacterium]|nr:hypothetical protein [Pirellulales bacterium]